MDFTQSTYILLLQSLLPKYNNFLPLNNFFLQKNIADPENIIILRHDVDRQPGNALEIAKLENELEIKGTYYFRIVPESFNEQIIEKIAALGHEIGYHYEDVDLVLKGRNNGITEKWNIVNKFMKEKDNYFKGDVNIPQFQNSNIPNEQLIDAAYESFSKNLEMFRKFFDVNTVCMHGSPRSKYDNAAVFFFEQLCLFYNVEYSQKPRVTMDTITINRKELKKIIRETFEDVINDKMDLIGEAIVEAMEDIGLAKAMEQGRTGEYVDTSEFKKKLTSKIKRLK